MKHRKGSPCISKRSTEC